MLPPDKFLRCAGDDSPRFIIFLRPVVILPVWKCGSRRHVRLSGEVHSLVLNEGTAGLSVDDFCEDWSGDRHTTAKAAFSGGKAELAGSQEAQRIS